ncbi:MAG: nitrogenase component 1, partial [Candidatus Binatia bacterium]
MVVEVTYREPQSPCMSSGAIEAIDAIKDAYVLLHSPWGCKFALEFMLIWSVMRHVKVGSTGIIEPDVIMGGEEKLKRCILQAAKVYDPKLIGVVNTCVGSTTREDIEAVISEVQPETDIDLIAVPTCGYEGDIIDGYSLTLELMVSKLTEQPQQRIPNSVNLVGWFVEDANFEELKRIVAQLDITLNCCLLAGSTLEMVKQAARAEANLILSEPIALKACDLMKEKFGLPYLCADEMAPWGLESTAAWIRKAAEFFGKEDLAEALIERELREARAEMDQARDLLRRKRVSVVASPDRVVPLTNFCCELG